MSRPPSSRRPSPWPSSPTRSTSRRPARPTTPAGRCTGRGNLVHAPGEGDSVVRLTIPLHKTAVGGDDTLTRRTLRCACTTTAQKLWPRCAAGRHLGRARGIARPNDPLFPAPDGAQPTRAQNIMLFNTALHAAGIPTDYTDAHGETKPLYGGHAARVAGAFFMAAQGVPMTVIQILGRSSSSAIERYIQAAPMARARDAEAEALGRHRPPADGLADAAQPPGTPPRGAHPRSEAVTPVRPEASPRLVEALRPADAPEAAHGLAEQHILHARAQKVHRPDPQEAEVDAALWKAPCGWRYGGARYYRIPTMEATAQRCRRCWKPRSTSRPTARLPASIELSFQWSLKLR